MDKGRFLTILVIIMIVVNLGMLAVMLMRGGHPPKHKNKRHEKAGKFIETELDFTEEQKTAYQKLQKEHQENVKQYRDSLDLNRELLFSSEGFENPEHAENYADKMGYFHQKLEWLTYEHFKAVYAICDENQKQKFGDVLKHAMRKMAPGPPPDHKRR